MSTTDPSSHWEINLTVERAMATKCLLNNQCLQHVLSCERTFPQVVPQPSKHGRSTNCLYKLEKLSRTSVVTVPIRTMQITADKGLKRSYTWDGATRSVEMRPRRKVERRDMGLYFPGPGEHWLPNNGVTRGVLQEGKIHFKSQQELLTWLAQKPAFTPRIIEMMD